MNAVFATGVVPAEWDRCLITPVHKRGSMLSTANYRPIAVGDPLSRLYALVLQARLDGYLETNHLRSHTQAGFRRNRSTCHQLFVLQHFVDKYAFRKVPLYACYVDLQSAYDLVVHHVLWACLRRKGVHGAFLSAIQSLYASPRYAICVHGSVGEFVPSIVGVRQGCPLSPLLFGVMLDDLPVALGNATGHHAPCLDAYGDNMEPTSAGHMHRYATRCVTNLDYADDIIMLSRSRQGMQALLRELHFFCVQRGLLVSPHKTFLVQLVPGVAVADSSSVAPLHYGGQPLRYEPFGAKYLGLLVAPKLGTRGAMIDLCQRGHNAWTVFCRRIPNLQCEPSIPLLVRLYTSIVRPAMLYGSEIWALLPGGKTSRRCLHVADHKHLAKLAGVPVGAHATALHLALRVWPFEWEASLRAARFWFKLWSMPAHEFYRHVAFDNWLACCAGAKNYARGMMDFYNSFNSYGDANNAFSIDSFRKVPVLPVDVVLGHLLSARDSHLCTLHCDPVSAPSHDVTLCSYMRYHHAPPALNMPALYELPLSLQACRSLLRFVLGCSPLPVHAGRRTSVPRSQRHCPLCSSSRVADEYHAIFACPALHFLRAGLFWDLQQRNACCVHRFMCHPDRFAVAGFLLRALRVFSLASPSS
jgi:hypothetical protein